MYSIRCLDCNINNTFNNDENSLIYMDSFDKLCNSCSNQVSTYYFFTQLNFSNCDLQNSEEKMQLWDRNDSQFCFFKYFDYKVIHYFFNDCRFFLTQKRCIFFYYSLLSWLYCKYIFKFYEKPFKGQKILFFTDSSYTQKPFLNQISYHLEIYLYIQSRIICN